MCSCSRLCRELYSSGAPALADKLRSTAGVTVSWQQLREVSNSVDARNHMPNSYSGVDVRPQPDNRTVSTRISVASLLRPPIEDDLDDLDDEVSNSTIFKRPIDSPVLPRDREYEDDVLVASREIKPSVESPKKSGGTRISWGDEKFSSPRIDSRQENSNKFKSTTPSLAPESTFVSTPAYTSTLDMDSDEDNEAATPDLSPPASTFSLPLSAMRVEIGKKPASMSPSRDEQRAPAFPDRKGANSPVVGGNHRVDGSDPFSIKAASKSNAIDLVDPHRQMTFTTNTMHIPAVRPPRPNTTILGDATTTSANSAPIASIDAKYLTSSISSMPEYQNDEKKLRIFVPPLTSVAKSTGVILEGWLEKKSSMTGFWKKVRCVHVLMC